MKNVSMWFYGVVIGALTISASSIAPAQAQTIINGQEEASANRRHVSPNVEFGVVPVPIPQFGVVPDASGRTVYNQAPPASKHGDKSGRYYNGYSYQWPAPYHYYGTPPTYYSRPGYSGPLHPVPNGFIPPWITSLPSGGYYQAAPPHAHYGCTVCHAAPCRCVAPSYPYGAYYPPTGHYPPGYYGNGYYGRDSRTTGGSISMGGDRFRVTVGGSKTTTHSSSTTYGGVHR